MLDLSPGSEAARLTRAACTLVTNLYPAGYTDFATHEEMVNDSRCIETARALHQTLTNVGIPARLMPVDIVVNNPDAYRLSKQHVPIRDWPSTAWSVGIVDNETAPQGRGWNGHMLVRVAKAWLCDPNAGQFHRPGKIHIPPGWTVEYPKDWQPESWAVVGIVSSMAPNPNRPQFPILRIRQRPDNLAWKRGSAATVDVSSIANVATEALTMLRKGELEETFLMRRGADDEAIVDVSSIIARYQGDAHV